MSKLYVTIGIPGAGKSTWLENNKDSLDYVIHSSDNIRAELGDVNDQSKNELVFTTLHKRIKEDLLNGKNVAYDATNLKRKNRLHFLRQIEHIPCEKICVLFATPIECCKANNANRERKVPEEVIERMIRNFEIPAYAEGWNDIKIVYWDHKEELKFNFLDDLVKWRLISQNNPHHSLSIGDHMLSASGHYSNMCEGYERLLGTAILMHDCGKPYVKEFKNSKGEDSESAHFYQHHSVGSYLSLFYLKDMFSTEDILYIALLIEQHMKPFLSWDKSDKAKEKDRKLFGDDFINHITILHKCDLLAH